MDKREALSQIRQFVLAHGLPRTDMTYFGIRCPYCGKSDRIRLLETPEELNGDLLTADLEHYKVLWGSLVNEDVTLGICKFCLNALRLDLDKDLAQPLLD